MMGARSWRLVALATLAGCASPEPFVCETAEQCVAGGERGRCEATGYCSFRDEACAQSGVRYDESAGRGLAGQCVGDPPPCEGDDCPPRCISALAAGGDHTCALLHDGTVACWGQNDRGQLGDGADQADRPEPFPVSAVDDALTIAAGSSSTFALRPGGLWGWGSNQYGNVGLPPLPIEVRVATPIELPEAFVPLQVASGLHHACALGASGALQCWGTNDHGQLGRDASPSEPSLPGPVALPGAAGGVVAGASHSCAWLRDGAAHCWGDNLGGQLGGEDDELRESAPPVPVAGLPHAIVEMAAGTGHTCARDDQGAVWCWGRNDRGQLGVGDTDDHPRPSTPVALDGPAAQITSGPEHACARTLDLALWCWGRNDDSQVGDGTSEDRTAPRRVTELPEVVDVAPAARHTCALTPGGRVWCWGYGPGGRLGNGLRESSASPVQVGLDCP